MKPKTSSLGGGGFWSKRKPTVGGILVVGGLCFMAGSLAIGATNAASASGTQNSQGGPTVVTQGTSPWLVSGTVGINNFPATQAVTGTVKTGDVTTVVSTAGPSGVVMYSPHSLFHVPPIDVSAYKEVTLIVQADVFNGINTEPDVTCTADYSTPDFIGGFFGLGTVNVSEGGIGTAITSFDPAPPNIAMTCSSEDPTSSGDQWVVHWELLGRAN
jgi:hypothetical protein